MFKQSQVSIKIGNGQKVCLKDVTEAWISQQIGRRQNDYRDVCVRVTIESQSGVFLTFPTSPCSSGGGLSRELDRNEERACDIWRKLGLNEPGFRPENIIAFLKQITN